MDSFRLMEIINFVSLAVGMAVMGTLVHRKLTRKYWPVVCFLGVRVLGQILCMPPLFFRKELGLSKMAAYNILFYSVWPITVLETVLMVLIVYAIYSMVLAPFEPLKKLGTLIFRWVAAIGVAVSLGVAVGPRMLSHNYAVNLVSQIQQAASILTLCLLLFVCFTLQPLGLSYRSRYFGACLGLGMMATVSLVQAAWYPAQRPHSMYSMLYFWSELGMVASMLVWGTYFAIPEPKGRMVLLPTTSPYFLWNKISAMLGDSPGVVAISGFTPDSLAPAEMEALLAASDKLEDRAPRLLQPEHRLAQLDHRAYGS